jgi:Ribonuclease G/E
LRSLQNLLNSWNSIEKNQNQNPPPVLYKDLSVAAGVIRDLLQDDVDKVLVDSRKLLRYLGYVKYNSPEF